MKHSRSKPRLLNSMLSLLLAISVIITTMSGSTLAVQASWASSIVDSTGDSTTGGTNEVKNGVLYTRTGYLCYMLTTDGQPVPGTTAKAFQSPGYNGVEVLY